MTSSFFSSRIHRRSSGSILLGSALLSFCAALPAQTGSPSGQTPSAPTVQVQLDELAQQLHATEERLQQSQIEIQRLNDQVAALRSQIAASAIPAPAPLQSSPPKKTSNVPLSDRVDLLEAQVRLHEQTKVESSSKYPIQLTGLVLFNGFLNNGSVDNLDFPSLASAPVAGAGTVATGATLRQTTLGIVATGPHVLGAQSSAEVNFDFGGGIPYSNYGTAAGIVRLRTGAVRLTWKQDSLEAGFVEPIISPLSPTSYATVAEPALAWAGNLWTWAPQLAYEHRFAPSRTGQFAWQLGLWDPPASGYNTGTLFRAPSAGERSGQPAFESRISYARADATSDKHLQIGISGYYSRQSYSDRGDDSWAAAADWQFPLSRALQLRGEFYRGRAISGLGGGVYKDFVSGEYLETGVQTFRLLNAIGGWSQLKARFTRTLEANAAIGTDNGFASDFHSFLLPPGSGATASRARNQMFMANLIFSPKTYLILSPEYRRIRTVPITGSGVTANVFTASFGVRF